MVSEQTKKELMEKENVCGAGTGHKHKDGENTREECCVVFVREKKDISALSDEDLVPSHVEGDTKTDVIEVGQIEVMPLREPHSVEASDVDTNRRHRPYPQGVSIGHYDITAGTAGFIGFRKGKVSVGEATVTKPIPVELTNNHVAANENEAEKGDAILQPGPYDGGRHIDEDTVGELYSFVPIESDGNRVDKAVVDVVGRSANSWTPRLGVPRETTQVSVGDSVHKMGRTTGYTEGEVLATNARIRVRYGSGIKEFEDQIVTSFMSKPGDSGSAGWKEDKLFGVLFAGSSEVTIYNKISHFLNEGTQIYLNPEDVYDE